MSNAAIQVSDLGKCYRLGERTGYGTLRESLGETVARPLRSLRGSSGQYERGPRSPEHVWALRDVAFDVQQGEVLGVIGRNGAGKSTLLKILARITKPTEGQVAIRGRVGSLLEVGTGFHPELTGRENIYLNGAILGMKRAEIARQFDEIVAFAEIERFIDTPVKRYSSGMYTRLAFAVAAHLDPDILVVDEVLAVGDAEFQKKCLGKLGSLSNDGRTVLFVSHNMNAIQRLCPRALLLETGRLVESGKSSEIVARYLAGILADASPDRWMDAACVPTQGNGKVRATSIKFHGSASNRALVPGGPLTVSLNLVSDSNVRVESVAVMISHRSGLKLINLDTRMLGEDIRVGPNGQQITFHVDELNLNPGAYTLGWWVGHHREILDYVEAGFTIEVADMTGPGFGARPMNDGVIACPFTVSTSPPADREPPNVLAP